MTTPRGSSHRTNIPRRSFIAGTSVAAAAVAAQSVPAGAQSSTSSLSSASPAMSSSPHALPGFEAPAMATFMHGVASGDPIPDSVVLWTRVTPQEDAVPGSGLGSDVQVLWEVAVDEGFTTIVRSGEVIASAAHDHTVHVDPHGLEPGTIYYYRFHALGATSPVGRTKTAPDFNADLGQLSLAVASCANWECGYFSAYRDMAERARRDEIDAVVFLGDYIYEYEQGGYVGKTGASRDHWPAWEIVSLQDYRTRHGRYKTDPYLQQAHASAPWVVVWDDHETANNSWRDGAENHTEGVEGRWVGRRQAALQAYFEWLPVRATSPSEGGHIYRTLRFGTLAELTMLDLRTYRDAETTVFNFADPNRTMLGAEQTEWVAGQIATSSTTWNVLGNSVMMAPLKVLTLPETSSEASTANEAIGWISERTTGIAVNSDQWDGYAHDREQLLGRLKEHGSTLLCLTGDIHSEWANEIYSGDQVIGCELVGTSISAPNVDEIVTDKLGAYHPENNAISLLVEEVVRDQNPWVHHLDFDAHGYAVARIRQEEVDMEFYRVSDVEVDNAPVLLAETKTWRVGAGFVR
ncbi:alkaline phosphatase D family protein [Corynebacterium breve]|uniref:Alkaline phosphatase D family protein n=1 Tax=Corynebacterium breve TaxID=3049799 RepID=A0ABY8VEJ0_9CORY|nr:alkaline phosphatase D family protein [Corynebacterium breve]WIM67165.1 alkaline phosphatase D family protein [Corynebacterium breve]